ncbi:MAG: phosphoglycerate kinase [Candidatus Latescibacterota bacterium]
MSKMTVRDVNPSGQRALVRVDFNVPLDDQQRITDDNRIRASLPTVQSLLERGAAVILMSHLGRPKGKRVPEMSLQPVASRLGELLGRPVALAPDCIGPEVTALAGRLRPGQVLLLENLRFYKEEEANGPDFARQLAALGSLYVNDAFGTAHRAHASTEGVTHHVAPSVAGLLMEKEITYLTEALDHPQRPFLAILGGAKVSGKLEVIQNLLDKVDALAIGGGMAYTFLKAQGLEVGRSLLEAELQDTARQTIEQARDRGVDLLLPVDTVVADRFAADARTQVVDCTQIPREWEGMDIGPRTRALFAERTRQARTVVWNGPLGVFEMEAFAAGTKAVAQALAEATQGGTVSIIGGGDTAAAVAQAGVAEQMTHISTGGGASLEAMSGLVLPGVAALTDREG